MGLFSRKAKPPAQPAMQTVSLTVTDLPNGWRKAAAGTSMRQDAIRATLASATARQPPPGLVNHKRFESGDNEASAWIDVVLLREPGNAHDPNAVVVQSMQHGQLGYLPADWAEGWAPLLDDLEARGKHGTCPAYIRRNESGALSVVLCLSTADYAERSGELD